MLVIHVLDMLWEILQPRNLLECMRSLPYMWLITWRSLHRRLMQTVVTIIAVSLGFAAYLCLLVVFGASSASVEAMVSDLRLPTPVIVRQHPAIAEEQTNRLLEYHYVDGLTAAIELTAYLATEQTQVLGFSPGDDFWKQYVQITSGDIELTAEGIALPEALAENLGLGVGDEVHLLAHAGSFGLLNRADLRVEAIFGSEYALFDQPVALSTAAIFQGYDIARPTLLFVQCRSSAVKQVVNVAKDVLFSGMDERPYPWLRESEFSPSWISDAKQAYSILWQGHNTSFYLDMARNVLSNNYTSARKLVWLIYAFSALCVFSILLITLLTRRRDIGILKSVGFDDIDIFTSFVLEAAFVSAGGVVLGIGISLAAATILSHFTGYTLSIGLAQVLKAAVLSFVLYLLSAMVPADMARYTPTIDLLREGALFNRWREDPMTLSNPQLVDRNRLA